MLLPGHYRPYSYRQSLLDMQTSSGKSQFWLCKKNHDSRIYFTVSFRHSYWPLHFSGIRRIMPGSWDVAQQIGQPRYGCERGAFHRCGPGETAPYER